MRNVSYLHPLHQASFIVSISETEGSWFRVKGQLTHIPPFNKIKLFKTSQIPPQLHICCSCSQFHFFFFFFFCKGDPET